MKSRALGGAGLLIGVTAGVAAVPPSAGSQPLPQGAIFYGDPLPVPSPPLPYGSPGGGAPELTASQALTFRRDFGLPTDSASLEAAKKLGVNNRFGLPLTKAEADEIKVQFLIDGNGPKAEQELREAYPDTFAEQSLDHSTGGTVTLSFLGQPPSTVKLEDFFPPGTHIVTRSVPYTKAELEGALNHLEQQLTSKGDSWTIDGTSVPIEMTDVNTTASTVDIYISPTDAEFADALYREMAPDYPMARIVVDQKDLDGGPISATNSNDPVIGGEHIQAHPIPSGGCTSGFSVHVPGEGDGLLTASHCDLGRWGDHTLWYLAAPNQTTTVGFDVRYANSINRSNKAEVEVLGWVSAQPKVWDWYSTDGAAYVVGQWPYGVANGYTLYQSDGHQDEIFMQPNGVHDEWKALNEGSTGLTAYDQTSYLCGVPGSSGSPIWTLTDRSPGGYDEVSAVGITTTSENGNPAQCGSGELVGYTEMGYDVEAISGSTAGLKTGMPPS